jgi:N-acetylglucosamine-6-sulfatase/uncharacterized sulfatase
MKPARAPNLLFVFADELRAHAVGAANEDPVFTPNLDRFASQSLMLTDAVSNYPLCSPHRAMLMTGRYPHQNTVTGNCNSFRPGSELQADHRCWSDVLSDRGYSLGYIGKWHLDSPHKPYVESYNNVEHEAWNEWCPPDRRHGFDFWYSYGTYDKHLRPMYWSTNAGRDEFHHVDQWGPEHETDLAVKYIANDGGKYRKADQPFALVVAFNPPHTPYDQYPEKYRKPYEHLSDDQLVNRPNVPAGHKLRKNHRDYFAMVTGIDEQFGRILAALDEARLAGDTIVIFTSDHGCCLGANNIGAKNYPTEESMRVPFMVRWPGQITPRRDDLMLSTPDIYPSMLGLMGLAGDIPDEVAGRDFSELWRTGKGDRPSFQWYMRDTGGPRMGARGIRTGRYTFVLAHDDGGESITLYDREEDPYQMKNVAAERPEVVAELREKLYDWLRQSKDPWGEK